MDLRAAAMFWDHVERKDPACYHFRKPCKCPRCHARGHALCHAPKIHTHLHKEKKGLLDVVIRIASNKVGDQVALGACPSPSFPKASRNKLNNL